MTMKVWCTGQRYRVTITPVDDDTPLGFGQDDPNGGCEFVAAFCDVRSDDFSFWYRWSIAPDHVLERKFKEMADDTERLYQEKMKAIQASGVNGHLE